MPRIFLPSPRIQSAHARFEGGMSMGKSKKKLITRAEIVRNCQAEQAIKDVVTCFKIRKNIIDADKFRPVGYSRNNKNKVSILKRIKPGKWHATGIGHFDAKDLAAAKEHVKGHSYTHIKNGRSINLIALN